MKKIYLLLPFLIFNSCIVLLPFTSNEGVNNTPSGTTAISEQRPSLSLPPNSKPKRTKNDILVRYYTKQLRDNKETTRSAAASYLGLMGPAAKDAIPDLIISLHDSSKYVRRASAKALGRIGSDAKGALEHLRVAAKDKDPWVAHTAQNAIKKIN